MVTNLQFLSFSDLLDINKAICSRMGEISNKDCKALEESINKGLKELTSTFVMPVRRPAISSSLRS